MFGMLKIYILANCDGNWYLPILHLPRVELHGKLQEKLHRVTGPIRAVVLSSLFGLGVRKTKRTSANRLTLTTFVAKFQCR